MNKGGFPLKKLKISIIAFSIALFFVSAFYVVSADHNANTNTSDTSWKPQETSTDEPINNIKSITLSQSVLNITNNKKGALTASINYEQKTSAKKDSIVWTSKDPNIATVSDNGIVTAVNCGKTYIICSSKNGIVKARCKIIVRAPYNSVKEISFTKDQIRLGKKDQRILTPSVTYGNKTNFDNEPLIWSSSDNQVATVSKNGVVKGKSDGTAYIKVKSKFSNKTAKCKVTVQKVKYVAFTFDDGPGEYTNKLLDGLEKYHGQATFFILGNRASAYKKQLQRQYSLGMEIGSHTYAHKNLKTLSKKEIESEISKTNKAVKNIIGTTPTLLRPPYGNYNKTVSKKAGVPMIYWSVDTLDWKYKNAKYVSKTILKSAKDGEILLLHDIHQTSVDGFLKALPKLRKEGFELVTVSELYQIKGKKLKKGVMYFGPNKDK